MRSGAKGEPSARRVPWIHKVELPRVESLSRFWACPLLTDMA